MSNLTKRLSELRAKGTQGNWMQDPNDKGMLVVDICPHCKTKRINKVLFLFEGNNKQQHQIDGNLIAKTINALPKLLQIIHIQGEALKSMMCTHSMHGPCKCNSCDSCQYSYAKAEQALKEINRIEEESLEWKDE